MPDFEANDALSSLPGAGPGGLVQPVHRRPVLVDYLDVALVLIAAPIALLLLGAPALGYAIGAGAWILQRVIAETDGRWIGKATEPTARLGRTLFESFGRIWLLAGAIVLAGVAGGRPDGLTAAVTIFVAYSVAFALRVAAGRPTGELIR
jgi:hypothetical protein